MMNVPLGKKVEYKDRYNSDLLVGIPRSIARDIIGLKASLPFYGVDIWNCYEVSWLNKKGKPNARILQLIIPADSENIIESKSLKLYLTSFNGTKFDNDEEVKEIVQKDCSKVAKKDVEVTITELGELQASSVSLFDGKNIDDLDIEITDYEVNGDLLQVSDDSSIVEEILYSNLLKSNCLVTNQPDWASIQIKYRGRKIDHESLLHYIVSFRRHSDFHEQCVEHIFSDIMQKCAPEELTVYAKYTRRGGIDINPYRTSANLDIANINKTRDIRQ